MSLTSLYIQVIEPALKALTMCRVRGWKANRSRLQSLDDELAQGIEQQYAQAEALDDVGLFAAVQRMRGKNFSFRSGKQVGELLIKLGVDPGMDATPKSHRQPNTPEYMRRSADVLKHYKDHHPVVPIMLEVNKLSHLRSQFTSPMLEQLDQDDLLYPGYNWGGRAAQDVSSGTVTGRPSCSKPNVMNIPVRTETGRRIRECFVSRFKSGSIVEADYSQIELRIMALLANDKDFLEVFRRGGDPHQMTADRLGIERYKAKTINFGVAYGATAMRISEELDCTKAEAVEIINAFWKAYPALEDFFRASKMEVLRSKELTGPFGMKRRFPNIDSMTMAERGHIMRSAGNWKIQHTASMLAVRAMGRWEQEWTSTPMRSILFGQLYDALYIDCHPEDDREQIKSLLQRIMVDEAKRIYPWLDVPIEIDVKFKETMGD